MINDEQKAILDALHNGQFYLERALAQYQRAGSGLMTDHLALLIPDAREQISEFRAANFPSATIERKR